MEEFIVATEHLHTEEMEDIIGKPPMWIYRWGISLILIVVLLAICVSVFISYPETIQTELRVHAVSSPYTIYFKDSVQLSKLYVQTGQLVKKGQRLADVGNVNGIISVVSPQNGKLIYAGIIHESGQITPKQPLFYIINPHEAFYGEMPIPRNSVDEVKPGQIVLISLKNYQDSDDQLKGSIGYITEDPLNGGVSIAEVDFNKIKQRDALFFMKNGLITNAKVITTNTTIFQRLVRGMVKTKNK